jgi:hypothetical protein
MPWLTFQAAQQLWPNAIWGGTDNVNAQKPPDWLTGLVNSYLANPTKQAWDHLMLGTGVQPQYANYTFSHMPAYLQNWLTSVMGKEPGG